MAFSLVGGISSFAHQDDTMEEMREIAGKFMKETKDFYSPLCYEKMMKKMNFSSSTKEFEKFREQFCEVEHEYWTACKGEISNYPPEARDSTRELHKFTNELYNCPSEKTSFVQKIISFFGLAGIAN